MIGEADRIREETGATVILVHHTGHGDTHRGRGTSALPGAVDSAIMVKAGKVSAELLKDSEQPESILFQLKPVAQSVVALPMSSRALDGDEDGHEAGLRDDLEKIRGVLEDEGRPMSKSALCRRIGGNRSRIIGSIDVYVERGFLTKTTKDRTHFIGLLGQSVGE